MRLQAVRRTASLLPPLAPASMRRHPLPFWADGGDAHSNSNVVEDDAGTWKLAYTSNSELFAFLAAEALPLVEVGEILQIVDAAAGTVVNRLAINTPLLRGSISAKASFEVTLHP